MRILYSILFCLLTCFCNAQIPTNQDCPNAIPICQQVYSTSISYSGEGNILNEIKPNRIKLKIEQDKFINEFKSGHLPDRSSSWWYYLSDIARNAITSVNFSEKYDEFLDADEVSFEEALQTHKRLLEAGK